MRVEVAEEVLLAEDVEPVRVAAHGASLRDALREAAEEGQRRQRGDERRQPDARDEEGVEEAAGGADEAGPRRWPASSGRPQSCQATPSMMATRPTMEPTERSMPPVMMMSVMGNAMSAISAARRPWLSRLSAVRKLSDCERQQEDADDEDDEEDGLLAQQDALQRAAAGRESRRAGGRGRHLASPMPAPGGGDAARPRARWRG